VQKVKDASGDAYESAQQNASKVLDQLRDALSWIVNLPPMSMEELQRLAQETQGGRSSGRSSSGEREVSKSGKDRSPVGSESGKSPARGEKGRSPSGSEEDTAIDEAGSGSPRKKALSMLASGLLMIIDNTKAAITGLATAVAHPIQSTLFCCACA
jgi:hypothetical protein